VEVPVDVHYSRGGWTTTDEDDGEPVDPDSDSSDGMTIWHLREDADVDKGRRRHPVPSVGHQLVSPIPDRRVTRHNKDKQHPRHSAVLKDRTPISQMERTLTCTGLLAKHKPSNLRSSSPYMQF